MTAPTTTETQVNEGTRPMTKSEERILGVVDCCSELVKGGLRGWSDARRALNMQAVNAADFQQTLRELERGGFIRLIFTGDVLTGIVVTSG